MLLTLCFALALGSYWVLEIMRKDGLDADSATERSEPDYFVDNFRFVRMSQSGQVEYRISGSRLTHHPSDDTHQIIDPVITSLGKERSPLTARSERALIDRNQARIHMYDNVRIDRDATPSSQAMRLTTSYLLFLTDEDIMRTDRPVEITLGQSRLTGIGMVANNATRQLQLGENVHALYHGQLPQR